MFGWVKKIFERNREGDHYYFVDDYGNWADWASNLEISQNHPILTPALLFVSTVFASARFKVRNRTTKKDIPDHWAMELLENPNTIQTGFDFFESMVFNQIAEGKCVVWKKKVAGFDHYDEIDELHILEQDKIEWPKSIKKDPFYDFKDSDEKIIYKLEDGNSKKISVKDLIFFFDLPNGMSKNKIQVKSRMDGLKQTLVNTCDSLIAKNIILKTNGKELFTGEKGQTPMDDDEKLAVESSQQSRYGLAKDRLRTIILRGKVNHKSLHIALRDLGLDESVKVDGNLIYTALHIPKDILSLEAKKTTYNNFKESMVSYIQNDSQTKADSVSKRLTYSLEIEPENEIYASYEHLPIMQFVKIERYKAVEQRGKALETLRKAGVPDELALDLCDFDTKTKLSPLKSGKNNNKNKKLKNGKNTKIRKLHNS